MTKGVQGTVQAVFDISTSGVTIIMLRDWSGEFRLPARLLVGAEAFDLVGYDWPRSTYNVAAAKDGVTPEFAVAVGQVPAERARDWVGCGARRGGGRMTGRHFSKPLASVSQSGNVAVPISFMASPEFSRGRA